MHYVIAADRHDSPTGRSFLRYMHNGIPVTSPFEDDAARMERVLAFKALEKVSRCFHGYGVEPVDCG